MKRRGHESETDIKLQNITLEVARGLVDWVSEHSVDAILQLAVVNFSEGERTIPFMIIDNYAAPTHGGHSDGSSLAVFQKILFYFRPVLPKLNPFSLPGLEGDQTLKHPPFNTDEYQLIKDLKKLYYYSEFKNMAFSRLKVRVWKGNNSEWEFQMEYKYNDLQPNGEEAEETLEKKSRKHGISNGGNAPVTSPPPHGHPSAPAGTPHPLPTNGPSICSDFFEAWIAKTEDEVSLKHMFSQFACLAFEKQERFKARYGIDDAGTYKPTEIKSWKLNLNDGTIHFYGPMFNQRFRMQILGTLSPKSWLRADELHPAKLPYHVIQISKHLYKLANTKAELVIKELLNRRIEISPTPSTRDPMANPDSHALNSAIYFGHMISSVVSVLLNDRVIAYFRCINPMLPTSSMWILLTEDLGGSIQTPHSETDDKLERLESIFNKVVVSYGNLLNHLEAFASYASQCGLEPVIKNYAQCNYENFFFEDNEIVEPDKWVCVVVSAPSSDEQRKGLASENVLAIAMFDEFQRYRGCMHRDLRHKQ